MAQRPNIDVRTLREGKALSQDMLATMAGVSVRSIRRMEAGERVSAETIRCVAAALDVTPVAYPDCPNGGAIPVQVQAAIPRLEFPSKLWGPIAMQGMAGVVLAAVFVWGWSWGWFDVISTTVATFLAVGVTFRAHVQSRGDGRYVVALACLIVIAFEIVAWSHSNFVIARFHHACAIAIGGAAIAGSVFVRVMGRQASFWTVPGLVLAGLAMGLAIAPLNNFTLDHVETRVQMESRFATYTRMSETLHAKADRTMRDRWRVYRALYDYVLVTPLGPPEAVPEDFHDFGLFARRTEAMDACKAVIPSQSNRCLQAIRENHPNPYRTIGFSAGDMVLSLYGMSPKKWWFPTRESI